MGPWAPSTWKAAPEEQGSQLLAQGRTAGKTTGGLSPLVQKAIQHCRGAQSKHRGTKPEPGNWAECPPAGPFGAGLADPSLPFLLACLQACPLPPPSLPVGLLTRILPPAAPPGAAEERRRTGGVQLQEEAERRRLNIIPRELETFGRQERSPRGSGAAGGGGGEELPTPCLASLHGPANHLIPPPHLAHSSVSG